MPTPHPSSDVVHVLSPDPSVAERVLRSLREGGLRAEAAAEAEGVREQLAGRNPFVAVVDLSYGADAVELVQACRLGAGRVVLVASTRHRQAAARLVGLGAYGYALKPIYPEELLTLVRRARSEARSLARRREGESERHRERTSAHRAVERRTARLLAAALRHRDGETSAHMERVGRYAVEIAARLGWSASDPETFRLAAGLHDLGKIGLPDAVLEKPGRLTPSEFRVVARHTRIGAAILEEAIRDEDGSCELLRTARTICLHHHERWDGGGYPDGLEGDEIPWQARVVAVADVYDALLHSRPYRDAVPEAVALGYLRFQRARRFDPRVVDAFLDILPKIREIRESRPELAFSRAVGDDPPGRST